MTHSLQVFNSELGQVRTLEIEGKIWFVASDVAKALGHVRPNDAINQHCRSTVKHRIGVNETFSRAQSLINDGELSVRNEDGGKKHA